MKRDRSTQSKPGLETGGHDAECWTLISTPAFAVSEIDAEPMQDAASGAFKPQDDDYLNAGPAPALLRAFAQAAAAARGDGAEAAAAAQPAAAAAHATQPAPGGSGGAPPLPSVLYLQGQRWGSALPAPCLVGGRDALGRGPRVTRLMDVEYDAATPPLVYERPSGGDGEDGTRDFLCADDQQLYYAGDFTSRRAPGFEAAALSGLAAAEHIAARLVADAS
jgi:hypothetical protein